MKDQKCPECDYSHNASTQINGEDIPPTSGDISICWSCGAINQFDENMNIIPLPVEVLTEIKETDKENFDLLMDTVIHIKSRGKIT